MSIIKIMGVGELPGMVDYLLTAAFIVLILEMISYFARSLFAIYCVTWGALFKYLTHGGERRFEKDPIKVIPFLSSEKFMQKFVVVKKYSHLFFACLALFISSLFSFDIVDKPRQLYIFRQPEPVPVHMIETINKLMRVQKQLVQKFGREATPEEIADEMELTVERVRQIMKMAHPRGNKIRVH